MKANAQWDSMLPAAPLATKEKPEHRPQPVQPDPLDLWMPTLTFLLGLAIGGGLVLQYLSWVL